MVPNEKRPRHILVIRLSAMGDVAMVTPILAALIQQYPYIKITVLTRQFFRPMFSQFDNVSVYTADVKGKHKGLLGLWKLYKELKKLRFDTVADLHNVLRSTILKNYFRLSGVPFYQLNKGRQEKRALTAVKNKDFRPLKTTHERYADVFAKIGLPVDLSQVSLLAKERLSRKTLTLIDRNTKKWIGVAPFAAHEGKMYPLNLMELVLRDLNATKNYQILLFGGGQTEQAQLDDLEKKLDCCTSVAGKISFQEELALISNLDLMLSMDSANAHLAAMYGIPTLTLWGVTHPYAGFYPFGQDANNALLADREQFPEIPTSIYGNKMPTGYEKAIETIRPEHVVLKVKEILGEL